MRQIDTVVIVMMENRSFDHMLGHLSLEGLKPEVDGLVAPLDDGRYENIYNGNSYHPWLRPDAPYSADMPHEMHEVLVQMGVQAGRRFPMNGFVESFADVGGNVSSRHAEPMAVYSSADVPITSFLAREFCPCDRWFTPLPTGTQPNRTMALSGDTPVLNTTTRLITGTKRLLPEWLMRRNIRWRVYFESLSYFALYLGKTHFALPPFARSTSLLTRDFLEESDKIFPQVVLVEPGYGAAGIIPGFDVNDNHAPSAVAPGEEFLWRVYRAVTSNPDRWARTVMILTYDEHGGFYDHVSPPLIAFPRKKRLPPVESAGPRVPSIIVSPYVEPTDVCHSLLDHTSILQFIAELFGGGPDRYSEDVNIRREQGVRSISEALRDVPRVGATPTAPAPLPFASTVLYMPPSPTDDNQRAFANAADWLMRQHPDVVREVMPQLVEWKP